jgi:flagellar biosynthesis protein FlhA
MTVGGLQRILQNLVGERVSIRDLPTILEGIAEATSYTKNIAFVTEHVRSRLARQLCDQYVDDSNTLLLATLSPEWESAFAHALVGDGEDKQLAMPPTTLQDFIQAVRKAYDTMGNQGLNPALVTSPMIRPYVRSIVERFRPQTAVLSQNEIHPKARIRTVVQV